MSNLLGCEFLARVVPRDIFTPEDLNEDQKMLKDSVEKFMREEVLPRNDDIENKKEGLMVELLKKAGDIGVFAIEIPKEYDGLGLDKVSALCVNEILAQQLSFAVSCEAHITIGTHPIVFFGNEQQKKKYLPDLGWARKISCYALTEPQAGSDALNAKTKAELTPDGKYYILNGSKQFITNAGFAELFIVFAKVDGKYFTAFIVEKDFGVQTGPDEKKMGQKGSVTNSVILDNVKVPKENVLGEIGRGHIVALNALNLGRMRLGGAAAGSAKYLIKEAVKYANERVQFGKAISNFGLIKWKIADMLSKTFAAESAAYRVTASIDDVWLNKGYEEWKSFEEYAVEATIIKVGGTEAFWSVADEAVQIHGGYGYLQDYAVERFYRDERVQRIYEGTNEINRLNIPDMIIKRAIKGRIDFTGWVNNSKKMLEAPSLEELKKSVSDFELHNEMFFLEVAKKILLLSAQEAFMKFGAELQDEQEILGAISDILIGIYFGESAISRATKNKNTPYGEHYKNMAQFYVHNYRPKIVQSLELISNRIGIGNDMPRRLSEQLKRIDLVSLSRKIADKVINDLR